MISTTLARELRDAGLRWEPTSGDQFVIPDRGLDDRVFSISEMTIDVRPSPVGRLIAFNGTVEWALDAIMQREVVWLPTEGQLRELLGDRFLALEATDTGVKCVVDFNGQRMEYRDGEAANAYGRAVLHGLLHGLPAEMSV